MKKIVLFFLVLLSSEIIFSQSWVQITDFPSTERDDGTSFVIGDTAYCGTGLKPFFVASNDMYSFDMNTETWATINSLPAGTERQYATGFSYNNFGFIFGGVGSVYYNDLWMYDPITGNWQAKTPLPALGRMGSSCFVINDTAYIVGGRTSVAQSISDVWAYCISADTWTPKNNLPFGARWRASATTDNTKGYLIFGKDSASVSRKELYEFNPATNLWTQISTFPGNGRAYAAMKFISGDLLVLAGLDSLGKSYNDMWRINPSSLVWQSLDTIPSLGRRGGMCFNSSTTIYYTAGINQTNNRLKETWKVFNPTTIIENGIDFNVELFPNPVTNDFTIRILSEGNKMYIAELYNVMGQVIYKDKIENNTLTLDIAIVPQGMYICKVSEINSSQTNQSFSIMKKIVVQH
ncbi:MAG: T9SS type A sorting domain-containing protein [Bacteroidetes bacterium]|nr:T9SS type A sorting domain-containing protein [Bacteroidota bacterium]